LTDIEVFRHMAQREEKIAEIREKWLTDKVEHLGKIPRQLRPLDSDQAAIGQARAYEAPGLSKESRKAWPRFASTGDGGIVEPIAEGSSAPSNKPLTVY
jgi:hypothetical protein